jgi:hypothetical protein
MAQPASAGRVQPNRRSDMANSRPIHPLYGGVIRDKCKTANPTVLKAYKAVGEDLLKDYHGQEKADLQSALKELDAAIAKH